MIGNVSAGAVHPLAAGAVTTTEDKPAPEVPDTPDAPDKPEAPAAPDRPAAKEPAGRQLVDELYIQLDQQADLREIERLPVGQERVTRAVDELRRTATRSQDDLLEGIRSRIQRSGAPLEVEVGERLWINNSMTVQVYQDPSKGNLPFEGGAEKVASMLSEVPGVVGAYSVDKLRFDVPPVESFRANGQRPLDDARSGAAGAQPGALPWNLEMIGVQSAWDAGITGAGVTVASLDTGVDVRHPALWSKYRGYDRTDGFRHEQNYFDAYGDSKQPGQPHAEPVDDNGHGTHVTGTIVGNDGFTGPVGVAPGAQFIAARGLGSEGGSTLDLLRGMQYLMAPVDDWGQGDARQAASIINHSWGGPGPSLEFTSAIRNMAKAGIVNVFAAGNSGYARPTQTLGDPGMQTEGITVGAVDRHGDVAPFSSTGPSNVSDELKPFVVAPGVDIVSSVPDGKYEALSGTSMAAPHVTGALALVNEALAKRGQSGLDLRDAKFVLERMVRDVDVPGPDDRTGHGLIDLTRMDEAIDALVGKRAG